jgi:hypothetical protein
MVHEQAHINDFISGKVPEVPPDYRKGKKNSTAVGIPKGPPAKAGERRAYRKQLECLQNSPVVKSGVLDSDIQFVQGQREQNCGNK